jgi:hypothetical protein
VTRRHRTVRSRLTMSVVVVALLVVGTSVGGGVAGALVPWKIVASPNVSGESNSLADVSCSGPTECVAVGRSDGNQLQPLIESWNGSGWSIVPSPSPSPTGNNLNGVSCPDQTHCMAVGALEVGADQLTLIESWDGTSWSVVPSPSTSPTGNFLSGVSCSDQTHCMAVGSAQVGTNGQQTLIESWDGTSWSVVPSPDVATSTYEELFGVSCTSPTDCTAVGFFDSDSGAETLVESWNGSAWSIVPSPNPTSIPGLYGDSLHAVSCTSSTACVAVGGNNTISTHFVQTLIESWDGTSWSVVPSPNGLGSASSLGGVSCINPSGCTAVGGSGGGIGGTTLIESWDGSSWSVVTSPNRGNPPASGLSGVSCVGPTSCTAVGSSGNNSSKTLVESMNGTPPKFSGPAPGQVTCSLTAKVSFSPPLTDSGGATTMAVKGELTNCTASTPGLSITGGKLTGTFPGPATGCAALGAGDIPATVAIGWKGQYNPSDGSFAGKASLTASTVTVTGEQEVTDGVGDVGFMVPGTGNDASTSGSFGAGGPNGASGTVSSGQTASQLSTLCSPTPRANKPPKPAKGIKRLTLTGSVTLG